MPEWLLTAIAGTGIMAVVLSVTGLAGLGCAFLIGFLEEREQ